MLVANPRQPHNVNTAILSVTHPSIEKSVEEGARTWSTANVLNIKKCINPIVQVQLIYSMANINVACQLNCLRPTNYHFFLFFCNRDVIHKFLIITIVSAYIPYKVSQSLFCLPWIHDWMWFWCKVNSEVFSSTYYLSVYVWNYTFNINNRM